MDDTLHKPETTMNDSLPEPEAEETGEDKLEVLINNSNAFFLIVNGIIIFFMQGGFAFLEAGAVRSKNTVNILIKNMLDALIGGLSYWAIGWGLAYGPNGNPFIGLSNFFSVGMESQSYASWFFQFVFAATAATIVSGSIAERCQFNAYFIYSILITGVVYPPVSHWAWDGDTPGWLNSMGYADFAGSGVVHLLGGCCALVATFLIGPRQGRFDKDGKPCDMPGHSVPLAGLGGFILLFGFLAFNGGSQASIASEGDAEVVALAIVNTVLGACGAGLTTLFLIKFLFGSKWSYLMTLNGSLTGMVSMCGGCNGYMPWAAILVGCLGGVCFVGWHFLMLRLQLDDPLDAVAVHGAGGFIGVLCQPIFTYESGIVYAITSNEAWRGLGVNLLGAVAIMAWSLSLAFCIFWPMRFRSMYRIDGPTEFSGNDMAKHGETAYPREAWVEMQYQANSRGQESPSLPAVISGSDVRDKLGGARYNDAFEMMPATGSFFAGFLGSSGVSKKDKTAEEKEVP